MYVVFLICVALGMLSGSEFFVNTGSFSISSGKWVCQLQSMAYVPSVLAARACLAVSRCIALGRDVCRPPPQRIPMVRGP